MATDIMATSTTELVASSLLVRFAQQASKRSELVATSVGVAGSFRSQLSSLASLEEDEPAANAKWPTDGYIHPLY